MIKKILKLSFIAAVAVAAGYTAYSQSQKAETLSDLTLENVEAIASGERGCTSDRNAICETSHNDYVDYRNN